MTRVPSLSKDEVDPVVHEAMRKQESQLGLVPQSLLTMAHRPRMAAAWGNLTATVMGEGTVELALKQLVAYVASATYGCRYCQAHTADSAEAAGVSIEKLQHAFEFETYPEFTDAERDALRVARDGAFVPNEVTDEHFERLRRNFSDEQIVEIVAVIAMFGWLNRWNDTMATTLEEHPLHFAEETLTERSGWEPWEAGPHAPEDRGTK